MVSQSLPQASVASQVWVYILVHELPVVVLESKLTVAPLQLSLAVGGVKDGVAVQLIVPLAPAAPIVGGCVSVAVIVWLTLEECLVGASVASQVWVYILVHELPVVVLESKLTVAILH